jgi:hypothetical protein
MLASAATLPSAAATCPKEQQHDQTQTPLRLLARAASGLCRRLGLKTGDRLEAELVDGAMLLRPVSTADRPIEASATELDAPAADSPQTLPLVGAAEPARRKPGRLRKNAPAEPAPAPTVRKARGGPRTAAARPDPSPVIRPVAGIGPAKLLKKADLPAAVPPAPELAPATPRPERVSSDDRSFVERRPFRQVEVRKLGPGRGHNRVRQPASPIVQDG